ncbi:MAG: hypothetical protein ISS70_05870 [Phycisphaerae bacterium]|nr:hypothetical protein [Phycisphaerae bacterium]
MSKEVQQGNDGTIAPNSGPLQQKERSKDMSESTPDEVKPEKQEALAMLKSETLLEQISSDIADIGVAGEEQLRLGGEAPPGRRGDRSDSDARGAEPLWKFVKQIWVLSRRLESLLLRFHSFSFLWSACAPEGACIVKKSTFCTTENSHCPSYDIEVASILL